MSTSSRCWNIIISKIKISYLLELIYHEEKSIVSKIKEWYVCCMVISAGEI